MKHILRSDTTDFAWDAFFHHSPISTQAFSPSGQTIRFNKAWTLLFGYTDEEAYAFNILKDANFKICGADKLILRAFEGNIVTVPPLPFPVRGRETSVRWIGGTLYPVKNSDGSLHEVTVVHHDVTDLKAAEELIGRLLRSDPSCPSQENLAHQALTHLQGYKPVRALPDFSDPKPLINLGLTRKEAEVLLWVAQGKSNSEAAIILNITVSTVKKHMEHVFEKLSVEKRGAASLIAIEALSTQ